MPHMHNPAHPGEVLKGGWPEHVTITAAAKQLGITRAALSRILNGHAAISADMALRLQAAYDLWHAEQNRQRPQIERLKVSA